VLDLLRGRLSVVVAAAGYGKSTAVDRWLRDTGETVTVLDDVHRDGFPATTTATRLVLISRRPIPVNTLLGLDLGAPVEIGPRQLALSPRQVARVLAGQYGVDDTDLAATVHHATAGWPALVHLAGAQLAGEGGTELLTAPATALHEYVTEEVLAGLPDAARELLTHIAALGPVSVELITAIGQERLAPQLALLARLGLLVPPVPGRGWYEPVPVVAAVVRTGRDRTTAIAPAADWHAAHGRPADALRLALAATDTDRCARLLREHGAELLTAGAATDVVAAVRLLPPHLHGNTVDLVHADALQATGDTEGALAAYARLAGGAETLPPALAWRYGAAVYLWGDPRDALAVLCKGNHDDSADGALLLAWTSAAHWLAGDEDECAEFAARAYETACATGDGRAIAAAHVALALCAHLTGDPVGLRAHYGRALELAEAARDTVLLLRIRVNLAAGLEQEGRLTEALAVLDPAVALARSAGYDSSLALALANQGALLHRLGRLDDAAASYQQAVEVYQRMHSKKVAYPLTGLGDLHRLRGQPAQAEAAYREALRAATEDGENRQGMVPALAGLARVLAETEPERAADFAEQAMKHAHGHWLATALVARAWVAWQAGAGGDARQDADAATDAAMRHRDLSGLAQALEVKAAATDDPPAARKLLREALSIWTESHAELEADRIRVALGRLAGSDGDLRLGGRLAESRLAAAGVPVAVPARPRSPGRVEIRVLGTFTVLIDGEPLPPSTWQSRKARDLLRVLVARRGGPVSRDELADLLWGPVRPDERQAVAHRLAVALSTLRKTLDPRKLAPQDHYILAGRLDVAMDLGRVTVDVEDLFAQARYGARLREQGRHADAWTVLTAADRAYPGEVFADDPYPEWARPLREEARATHLRVLRMLVELAGRAGEVDDVVDCLLRILSIDPYDEQAHRDLVANLAEAGRHGEASRAFQRYSDAMREIGVPVREVPR
jgi:DNA-binding SARP family transcriptional activator/ATP/maltotriose-dependent transcriptional regulator MalT